MWRGGGGRQVVLRPGAGMQGCVCRDETRWTGTGGSLDPTFWIFRSHTHLSEVSAPTMMGTSLKGLPTITLAMKGVCSSKLCSACRK